MAKYCSNCGSEVNENAIVCVNCGCAIKNEEKDDNNNSATTKSPKVGLILGILGIVFAWLYALIGHALSIIGIIISVNEYKTTNNRVGLIVSIIGESCAIFSSLIGVIIALS